MERRLSGRQAFVVGAFVLGSLCLAAGGLFLIGEREGWAGNTLPLETAMRNAQGLRAGTQVRVLGIVAGQVTAIQAPTTPGQPVVVHFFLRPEHRNLVRSDAIARVVKDGIVGERFLEIEPGTSTSGPAERGARIVSTELPDWESLIGRLNGIVSNTEAGKGTLGKLMADDAAYQSIQKILRKSEQALDAVGESYGSAKDNWVVRQFVKDRYQLLVRPEYQTQKKVLTELQLFEKNKATLTAEGEKAIDELVPWIKEYDSQSTEVLVASFAEDETDGRLAEITTAKQADAVIQYLIKTHKIHKTGWFSRRTVSAHGFGNMSNPDGQKSTQPRRTEILMFVKE